MSFELTVVEVAELTLSDGNRSVSPFCVVENLANGKKFETEVMDSNPNPVWNAKLNVPMKDYATDVLSFSVCDDERDDGENLLGSVKVRLNEAKRGEVFDEWFDLVPGQGVSDGGGLHIIVKVPAGGDDDYYSDAPQPAAKPADDDDGYYSDVPPKPAPQPAAKPADDDDGYYSDAPPKAAAPPPAAKPADDDDGYYSDVPPKPAAPPPAKPADDDDGYYSDAPPKPAAQPAAKPADDDDGYYSDAPPKAAAPPPAAKPADDDDGYYSDAPGKPAAPEANNTRARTLSSFCRRF